MWNLPIGKDYREGPNGMFFDFEDASGFDFNKEKNFLVQQLDEAFGVHDKASCVDVIEQLYTLLDSALGQFYRGHQ